MCRSIPVIAVFVSLAFAAQANDAVEPSTRTTVLVPEAAAKAAIAPFAGKAAVGSLPVTPDQVPQLPALGVEAGRDPQRACRFALCYDAADGHLAYPGSREYMPTIAGLTAERISLRRNRIIFKYSF